MSFFILPAATGTIKIRANYYKRYNMIKHLSFIICLLLTLGTALAHPMPSTVVTLSVEEKNISGEARIPLPELGSAVGDDRVTNLKDPFFITYFQQHIQAVTAGKAWTTHLEGIGLSSENDPEHGNIQMAVVQFTLTPTTQQYLHHFTFYYDAVIHQVVTHSALIYIQQDWANGLHSGEKPLQAGIIAVDVPTGKLAPLQVNLEEGSWWKGFKSMFLLGMQHIKEGTDHLLFLLVLLLPCMLLIQGNYWGKFGGVKYSIRRLLQIVTAFTIGHSVTLLISAVGWMRLPSQPVEILIAVSIFVSAIHAIYPLFPGKEMYVAAGFGLIHGLAFAAILTNMKLNASALAVSIVGFNLGIEAMQLFIVLLTVPWLMLLSTTAFYKWIRIAGGVIAAVVALAWVAERSVGKPNWITDFVRSATQYAGWYMASLGAIAVAIYFTSKKERMAV